MDIVTEKPTVDKTQNDTLGTIDLIDAMLGHHQDEAFALVELALWHQEQAEALAAERRTLAADVSAVLAEAAAVLR